MRQYLLSNPKIASEIEAQIRARLLPEDPKEPAEAAAPEAADEEAAVRQA